MATRDDRLVAMVTPAEHHARGGPLVQATSSSRVSVSVTLRLRPVEGAVDGRAAHAVLLGQLRDRVLTPRTCVKA